MNTLDRILLAALVTGVWASIGVILLKQPAYALSIDASDIDGLEYFIVNVVEICRVRGDVYVYGVAGSEGYGEIDSARIRC